MPMPSPQTSLARPQHQHVVVTGRAAPQVLDRCRRYRDRGWRWSNMPSKAGLKAMPGWNSGRQDPPGRRRPYRGESASRHAVPWRSAQLQAASNGAVASLCYPAAPQTPMASDLRGSFFPSWPTRPGGNERSAISPPLTSRPEATPPEARGQRNQQSANARQARNKAATATDADAAPAEACAAQSQSVAPVDDGPAQQRDACAIRKMLPPGPSALRSARRATSSRRGAAADTAPVVRALPAPRSPSPAHSTSPAEAAEGAGCLPADAGTPAKSASLGDSQLVSAEHARGRPQSDALAAGEVDETTPRKPAETLRRRSSAAQTPPKEAQGS